MKIQIEDNVPIPSKGRGGPGRPKCPERVALESLQPNQSFVCPLKWGRERAYAIAKTIGITIKVRALPHEAKQGRKKTARVWRVR